MSSRSLDRLNIRIPFEAFLATLSMWSFQVMHSSTITPSVLVDETRLMLSDSIDQIGSVSIWDNLCLDPINIYSVFLTLKINLLVNNHQ